MSDYKRMWENNGHRPYWAQLHVAAFTAPFSRITGFSYTRLIFVINKDAINTAYLNIAEMQAATKYFSTWWFDKKNVDKYFRMLDTHFKEARKIEQESKKLDLKKLSTEAILIRIQKLADMHGFSYIFVTQPQHVLPLEKRLKELIADNPNANEIIAAVTTVHLPFPFDAEQQEVAMYKKKWKSLSTAEKQAALKKLAAAYGWFGGIEGESAYGSKHYEAEILSPQPNEKVQRSPHDATVRKEIKELGHLIGVLSNQRIWARWHGMVLRYYIKQCIKELARRWKQPALEYATIPEIIAYHKIGKPPLEEMSKRKEQGYVATLVNSEVVLLTGIHAEPYLMLVREDIASNKIIGQCASPGKVSGKVRIISFADTQYHKEIALFQEGEILVTGMTRPQIAHLCRKAAAIVTDEGGITSHAAIVSREFKIPCVIGTHNATKVLKTGDVVEVNAEKGVVRKL